MKMKRGRVRYRRTERGRERGEEVERGKEIETERYRLRRKKRRRVT
jgi:hypothetical protein